MNQKAYIKKVCKQLKCTNAKKKEIARQLESDISSAQEQGETMEQIIERMGMPKEVAAEFNENMSEDEIKGAKKSKWIRIIGIAIGVLLLLGVAIYLAIPKTTPIEESKVFDSEQVEIQTIAVILALNLEDYDTLQAEYAAEQMKSLLTKEQMDSAKSNFDIDWKSNISFGTAYITEVSQFGKHYATVQMTVTYGEASVTYTLSFDEDYKLAGLYMR